MGDNPLSPNAASPRRLPIPSAGPGANTNSALKGILIKPKRILPPQPDKLKRGIQENAGSECKPEEIAGDTFNSGFTSASKGDGVNVNSTTIGAKVVVPRLNINVDKLKNFFQLQGSAVGRKDKKKTDLNENDIYAGEREKPVATKSQTESVGINQTLLLKDNTVYSSNSKVKEWCSSRNGNAVNTKMASDHPDTKPRSPSPKSSTTWDRSSSGYSSDERADPRSPPPSHSASISVSSKTETEATNEDDVNVSQGADVIEEKVNAEEDGEDSGDNNDEDTLKFKDESNCDLVNLNSNSLSIDDLLTSPNECNVLTLTPTPAGVEDESTGGQCENCDSVNNLSAEKNDTTGSCVNFSFDVPQPQNSRRPVWTAASNSPGNGRIQYRKSVSESAISLRHPSRQGIADSNFNELAVCGKSFAQTPTPNSVSTKTDINVQDGTKLDVSGRTEILSPTSAFTPIERPVKILDNGADFNTVSDSATNRAKYIRPPLVATCRSPKDFKSFGINGKII